MDDLVTCPNCGQEQQRIAMSSAPVPYVAICGPTAGCGHKWYVTPAPMVSVNWCGATNPEEFYTEGREPEDDLLPCPRCGGLAEITSAKFGIPGDYYYRYGVKCRYHPGICGIHLDIRAKDEVGAVEAWNRRITVNPTGRGEQAKAGPPPDNRKDGAMTRRDTQKAQRVDQLGKAVPSGYEVSREEMTEDLMRWTGMIPSVFERLPMDVLETVHCACIAAMQTASETGEVPGHIDYDKGDGA